MLKLIGIVRVSSKGQKVRETPETQRAVIQGIARAHGGQVIAWVDEAITVSDLATTPSWTSVVVPVLQDPEVHIACYAIDRIARPRDFGRDFQALEALRSAAKRIYLPDGEVRDLASPTHFLQTLAETHSAGVERHKIVRRTRDGKARAVSEGRAAGGPQVMPPGITYDRKSRTWAYTDKAETIREIYHLLVDDRASYSAIGQRLGVPESSIPRWVTHPLYRGLYLSRWRRDTTEDPRVYGGPGQAPQLVSDAVWDAAQAIVRSRAEGTRRARVAHAPHLAYSGYVYSAYEQVETPEGFLDLNAPRRHVIYGHAHYGTHGTAYGCRCQHEGWPTKCGLRSWQPAERLQGALDAYLVRYTAEGWFIGHVEALLAAQVRDAPDERPGIEAALEAVRRRLTRLEDLYIDGGIERTSYDTRREALRAERTDLERRLTAATVPTRPSPEALRAWAQAMAFGPTWPVQARREWLQRYDVRIYVANDGVASATVVLPPGDGGMPIYVPLPSASWTDIVGYDISDYWAIIERDEGLYRAGRVLEILGGDLKYTRLKYLMRLGLVPRPQIKRGNDLFWTLDEIEATRVALRSI